MMHWILFFITGFIFNNCCGPRGIDGSGRIISESRNLEMFNSITLQTSANIYIDQSNEQSLRIEAKDNILPHIRTTVDRRTLIVSQTERICRHEPITIFIQMKDLHRMKISGSGKIVSGTKFYTETVELIITGSGKIDLSLDTDELDTQIIGAGTIQLAGESGEHNIKISGSGNVKASEFKSNNCSIKISGSGNCDAYAKNNLDVKISGSGNVYYRGNPENINKDVSGSGKLRKAN